MNEATAWREKKKERERAEKITGKEEAKKYGESGGKNSNQMSLLYFFSNNSHGHA